MSDQYRNQHSGDHGDSGNAGKRKRMLIGAGIVGLVIVIVFVMVSGGTKIKPWLDDHYQHVSGSDPDDHPVIYRSDDDARNTVSAVVNGTDPDDRFETGSQTNGAAGAVYLRYGDDWIVEVSPDGSDDSRITLEEFDRAYRGIGILPVYWGSYYGRSSGSGGLRGGGSGFGK